MITIHEAYEGTLYAVQEVGERTVFADFASAEDAQEYIRAEELTNARILKVTVEEV